MSTILGVFDNTSTAEAAIADLEGEGFSADRMSVVLKENNKIRQRIGRKGGRTTEGAVSGATTGGIIGGLAGLLIGIGVIAIPGIGGLLIGGPLAAALGLTGAAATTVAGAATGAVAGGLIGALTSLGIPEESARVYESRIKAGGVLLAVPAIDSNEEERVRNIFSRYDAEEVQAVQDVS